MTDCGRLACDKTMFVVSVEVNSWSKSPMIRKAKSPYSGIPLVVLLTALAFPGAAYAHEKWFHDAAPYPTHWEQAHKFPQIIGITIAVAFTVALGVWWRARGGRDLLPGPEALGATPDGRARFYALVPLILGIHAGLPLIVLGIKGQLFSPNNQLEGAWVYWLGVATAWLLINMTLTIFSWVELVGHLPLYGVMAILLVWTPQEEDQRLWIAGVLKK